MPPLPRSQIVQRWNRILIQAGSVNNADSGYHSVSFVPSLRQCYEAPAVYVINILARIPYRFARITEHASRSQPREPWREMVMDASFSGLHVPLGALLAHRHG